VNVSCRFGDGQDAHVPPDLLAFLGVSVLVIATPGQDTALTIRNTLAGGRRSGVFTAIGVSAGQAVWTLVTSAGLAAVLVASERAFHTLKLVGAAYLILLGIQSLLAAIRREPPRHRRADVGRTTPAAALRQGVLSNLANPKMAVFFTSLLPQFGGPEGAFTSLLLLGLLFATLTLAWLSLYAAVVARAGDLLRRPRVRRTLDAALGTVLVALGLRVATSR